MRITYCASCHTYMVDAKLGVDDPAACSSCFARIDKKHISSCDSLGKAIFAAVKIRGDTALTNPKLLIAIMSDAAPSLNREIHVFSKTLNSSCANLLIQSLESNDTEVDLLVRKINAVLIDEEGLSDFWAEKICSSIIEANSYLNYSAPKRFNDRLSNEEADLNEKKAKSAEREVDPSTPHADSAAESKEKNKPMKKPDPVKSSSQNTIALLNSGFKKLDEKDWAIADTYFSIVLRNDRNNIYAYLGLAMKEGRCRSKSDFEREYTRPGSTLPNSKYVAKIRQLGNPAVQTWLKSLDDKIVRRPGNRWLRIVAVIYVIAVIIVDGSIIGYFSLSRKRETDTQDTASNAAVLTNWSESSASDKRWGPERATFTMESPASYPVFNSIINNPAILDTYDERDFIRIGKIVEEDVALQTSVQLEPGNQYLVYIYYHNNASATYNDTEHGESGIALNARLSSSFPSVVSESAPEFISAVLSADNADPKSVWAKAEVYSNSGDIHLRYVKGSAKVYNDGSTNKTELSEELFNSSVLLGFDELNGVILGGKEYDGVVTYVLQADTASYCEDTTLDDGMTME